MTTLERILERLTDTSTVNAHREFVVPGYSRAQLIADIRAALDEYEDYNDWEDAA